MATITKNELQNIMSKAPAGTSEQDIVNELKKRGHTIEGVQTTMQTTQTSRPEASSEGLFDFVKPVTGAMQTGADFVQQIGGAATDIAKKSGIPLAGEAVGVLASVPGAASEVVEGISTGVNWAANQANKGINTWTTDVLMDKEARLQNPEMFEEYANPMGWLKKEVPTAIATAVSGASKISTGLSKLGDVTTFIDPGSKYRNTMDTLMGVGEFTGAIAPLLPDFAERFIGDVVGTAYGTVDNVASAGLANLGVDPDSDFGQYARQDLQTVMSLIPVFKGAKMKASKPKGFGSPKGLVAAADDVAAQTVSEIGAKAPISATTRSQSVSYLESLSSKGFFGQRFNSMYDDFQKASESFIRKGINEIADIETLEGAGLAVSRKLNNYVDDFKSVSTKIYDDIASKMKDVPAITDNTIGALDKIIAQQKNSLIKNPLLDKITELKRNIEKNVMWDQLKQTRTDIGNMIKSGDTIANQNVGALKYIAEAMKKDIDSTIGKVDSVMGTQLAKINASWAKNKQFLNDKFSKNIIEAKKPEKIIGDIVKPKEVTRVRGLMDVLDPEGQNYIRGGLLMKMIDDSTNGKLSDFSVSKFTTQLKKYGDDTLREVFTDEQYQRLIGIKKVGENLAELDRKGAGSQTAFIQQVQSSLGGGVGVGALATGGFVGGAQGMLATAIGSVVMQGALAKFIMSDVGRQFLGGKYYKQFDALSSFAEKHKKAMSSNDVYRVGVRGTLKESPIDFELSDDLDNTAEDTPQAITTDMSMLSR